MSPTRRVAPGLVPRLRVVARSTGITRAIAASILRFAFPFDRRQPSPDDRGDAEHTWSAKTGEPSSATRRSQISWYAFWHAGTIRWADCGNSTIGNPSSDSTSADRWKRTPGRRRPRRAGSGDAGLVGGPRPTRRRRCRRRAAGAVADHEAVVDPLAMDHGDGVVLQRHVDTDPCVGAVNRRGVGGGRRRARHHLVTTIPPPPRPTGWRSSGAIRVRGSRASARSTWAPRSNWSRVRVGLQRHLVARLGAVVGVEGGVGLGPVQQELLVSSISPASMARP